MSRDDFSSGDLEIDESGHRPLPSIWQRGRQSLWAMVLAVVFLQVLQLYGATRSGSMLPGSVILYFDSPYFWGYLGICGLLGWLYGDRFTGWLNARMGEWKFW